MTGTLEICIDDAEGLAACRAAGVDRIELCAALALGGLTPGPGLMRAAARSGLPVYAMIRPRAGGFGAGPDDLAVMRDDIAMARDCGLAGVVLGVARPDGTLDTRALETLCAAAHGMGQTLHRVIDLVPDPLAAIDEAVALGFERVLSSGQARRAPDGAEMLARMHRHAAGRIEIMAGAGVTPDNLTALACATGLRAFHASCGKAAPNPPEIVEMGFAAATRSRTDAGRIRALKARIAALDPPV